MNDRVNLQHLIAALQVDNTIVIVFANQGYLPVLNNWLYAIDQLGVSNYLVVALDDKLYANMASRGIPVLLRTCNPALESLWVHRLQVIQEILNVGFNVLHSDADAVWLKNPLEKYIYNQPYDLIFSQGSFWPLDVYKSWGFVLCCGFFFMSANSVILQWIETLVDRVKHDKDDQVSVNRLLLEKNIQWPEADSYALDFQGKRFCCYKDVLIGKGSELSIALLPHARFQRVKDQDDDVYIKHIISAKKTDSIMQVLQDNNCLFINHHA